MRWLLQAGRGFICQSSHLERGRLCLRTHPKGLRKLELLRPPPSSSWCATRPMTIKDDEVAEAGDRDAAAGLAVDPKARAEEELEQRKNGDGLRLDRQGKQPDEERA
jgi:hypothetical protein